MEQNREQIKNVDFTWGKLNMLNSYLEYLYEENILEQSKWKAMVAAGKVSRKGIEKLRKSGLIKPEAEYWKGIEKGTENIMKKSGMRVLPDWMRKFVPKSQLDAVETMGPSTILIGNKKFLIMPKDPNKFIDNLRNNAGSKLTRKQYERIVQFIKRHEADEGREATKNVQKFGKYGKGFTQHITTAGPVGVHVSPAVLQKEKRIADYASKLYKGSFTSWYQLRNRITKEYGEFANMSKTDQRKLMQIVAKRRKELLNNYDHFFDKAYNELAAQTKSAGLVKTGILGKFEKLGGAVKYSLQKNVSKAIMKIFGFPVPVMSRQAVKAMDAKTMASLRQQGVLSL